MIISKADFRKKIYDLKKQMNAAEIQTKSQQIISYLMSTDDYHEAKTIMTYLSFPAEVQTDELVNQALKQQKKIAVPVCEQKKIDLIPSLITSLSMVKIGYYGIREPEKKDLNPIAPSEIDLIVIPGVVFDEKGNRIGNGKGYYDNFLSKAPKEIPKIALAFEFQVLDVKWQVDQWDIPVDGIITEKGIRYFNR